MSTKSEQIDQESEVGTLQEQTLFNSVQLGNPKDILMNTEAPSKQVFSKWMIALLAYQSFGVVYGDLGTSPLYTLSSTFSSTPDKYQIIGAVSIVIWSLTLVVSVKYCVFVMSADDNGEGGTFALYSLLSRYARISWNSPHAFTRAGLNRHPTGDIRSINRSFRQWLEQSLALRHIIHLLSVLGVCLVLADGVLTPAQTVLGAIQGLRLAAPSISDAATTGISEVILIAIFAAQPFGTSKIAFTFAPIVVIWLALNLGMGITNVIRYDASIFQAFSPYWIYHFFAQNGRAGWEMMGGTLLAITGVEAMFADLGHFSATSIRIAWLCFAYPCLLMAYIGQGALLIADETGTAWKNAFYAAVPNEIYWLVFVWAILAAIVASQAMISACFSILKQAMMLSNFPNLEIKHTSKKHLGQIYIPVANWLLMIGTVCVAAGFKDTVALGNAYGACITMVLFITTLLMTLTTIIVWRWNVVFSLLFLCFFGLIDGAYLTATLRKVPEGAWFTVALALALAVIMMIWKYGMLQQWAYEAGMRTDMRKNEILSPAEFLVSEKGHSTLAGLLIVFDPIGSSDTPPSFQRFLDTVDALPAAVIFCHIRKVNMPSVPEDERLIVFRTPSSDHHPIYRIILRQGFNDLPGPAMDLGTYLSDKLITVLQNQPSPSSEHIKAVTEARTRQIMYLTNAIHIKTHPRTFFLKRALLSIYSRLKLNTMENRQELYGVSLDKTIQLSEVYEF
ncbi:potassium transporter-domain-containing protein [Syncephalastrum racemosum]|uniref:Potassium transporter-domain-containing protein n=1 Tax=Syncephalastrum racemosum TaxID=13706 RepID=A0A1X2HJ26_SYNRA|nr:potassium transporter-domain-containing protein [Syncephalastrum racemosum]